MQQDKRDTKKIISQQHVTLRKAGQGSILDHIRFMQVVILTTHSSRNPAGALTYLRGKERADMIRGLPVFNIESQSIEEF